MAPVEGRAAKSIGRLMFGIRLSVRCWLFTSHARCEKCLCVIQNPNALFLAHVWRQCALDGLAHPFIEQSVWQWNLLPRQHSRGVEVFRGEAADYRVALGPLRLEGGFTNGHMRHPGNFRAMRCGSAAGEQYGEE